MELIVSTLINNLTYFVTTQRFLLQLPIKILIIMYY